MSKKVIETVKAPKPVGPYSQAVKLGSLLFCSGQIPIVPETNEVLLVDVKTQAKRVMDNLKAVVETSGYSMDDVLKTTIFLTDMNDFAQVNEIYSSYFSGNFPARSTIAVAGLPKGVKVEVEAIVGREG